MDLQVQVVDNSPEHYEFIRLLRNDPRVAEGFLESASITAQQQSRYMNRFAHCYMVALVNGRPAGYGGVVDGDLRVCVHPDYQGQGIGGVIVARLLDRFPGAQVRIKWGNEASFRLFAKFGYEPYVVLLAPSPGKRGIRDMATS